MLPPFIVMYHAAATVVCVLCMYDEPGLLRPNARWSRYIVDVYGHVQKRHHQGRVARNGMMWAHVVNLGMNGTAFAPSPQVELYRCTACSLGPAGNPVPRHSAMPYGAMAQHITTPAHADRCADGRLTLHAAGGILWAVPVVAAPVLAVAVQPPVVVAPVPVVAPAVPVVVPRQPQP